MPRNARRENATTMDVSTPSIRGQLRSWPMRSGHFVTTSPTAKKR
jgi:hypothetical protein